MEENKALIVINKNGNIRSNESGIGLYSRFINQAKRNSVKNTPCTDFQNLSDNDKALWEKAMNEWNEDMEKKNKPFNKAISPSKFYDMKADQIQFTRLHEIVIDTLEEMYNQQSVDNVYNWMKGNNGYNYENMGCVYTNPTQIAKYIWGVARPEYIKKIVNVLRDLSRENVYLSRVEKKGKNDVHIIKKVTLIISCGSTFIKTKDGIIKHHFSYIQLHPVFFEKISRFYIPRRNNLISKLRDFYYEYREKTENKQRFMLPPDESRHMAHYLYDFAVSKNYKLLLDEETIARELNIKEFEQRRISRGRTKISTALDALTFADMIIKWKPCIGKKGQQQYSIELNPAYFGHEDEDETANKNNEYEKNH